MKLAALLGVAIAQTNVILVGKPEITTFMTSDDEPYYAAQLKTPITVRCSVDPLVEAFETDEVFIRESALNSEDWTFVDEKKPEEGYFMKDWVVDFSKSQMLPIYQSESIKKWGKGNRTTQKASNLEKINAAIRAGMAARAGK
jgi:hypothetical protein